ncbi:hypothetical protein BT93_K2275 [Corymbia citriodora subsp. variegata]|nr:hypothetical protein BT93_K2275 [Corymbia citriodora subsp. variegata]
MELVLQTEHTTKATPIRNKKRTESPSLQDAIGDSETGDLRNKKGQKIHKVKKQKRLEVVNLQNIEEMELMETSIEVVKEEQDWALVASPNKSPQTP